MLGYDPLGQSYGTDETPRGKTNGVGRTMRCPHHHTLY
jgi:hypothetical protein